LPIETTEIATVLPFTSIGHNTSSDWGIAVSPELSKGTFAGSSTGAPISTVMLPSLSMRGAMMPDMVSTRMVDLSVSFFQ
jgi:hypothetical protein